MITAPEEPPHRLPLRERLRRRRQTSETGYDAFLSYSRTDVVFATRLQRSLERFAKPWNRMRAMRVFRDMSSLAPESDLWTSIERQMRRSAWFILLLSPEAAASKWVNREVRWWLDEQSPDRMLIVITDGELLWDEHARDFARSSALAPELNGGFAAEPSWVNATWSRSAPADDDPRLEDVTASLASAIKATPKDELFAASVHEHRRTMRLATTGLLSLVALLVLAAVAGLVAYTQRNVARSQATLAVSRQLAAVSSGELASNLDVSLLLAVEAVRRDDNPQARSALMAAAFASPHLVRYFVLPDRVTSVAGSADGRVLAAGLADGRVMRWQPGRSTPRKIAKLPNAVTEVALDATGEAVVATDGSHETETSAALVVRAAGSVRPLIVPEGQQPTSVGITPSGGTVLLFGGSRVEGGARTISVVDGRTGKRRALYDVASGIHSIDFLVPSDNDVVLLYGGYAERRDLDTFAEIDHGGVSLGARQEPGLPSADGAFLTATNGLRTIPVWSARTGRRSDQRPDRTASAPITGVGPLALSPDGARLAIADSGVIYVTDTVKPGAEHPAPVVLEGNGNVDEVRFLGSGSRLVSVSRTKVALWNLEQPDRLARSAPVPIQFGCTACEGPAVALSDDRRSAALIDGAGRAAALADFATGRSRRLIDGSSGFDYLPPLFGRGGTPVFPVSRSMAGPDERPPELAGGAISWEAEGDDKALAIGRAGDTAVSVSAEGEIFIQRLADGRIIRTFRAHPKIGDGRLDDAAVAPSGDRIATLLDDRVSIADTALGKVVTRFPAPAATDIAFGGDRLFVQMDDGSLEVRVGGRLERTVTGDPSYVWPPVPNPQGTLVARQRANGQIALVDADTGSTLVMLPPNPGAAAMKIGVNFSPDGRRLVTVTEGRAAEANATMIVRDLSLPVLARSACRAAGHELSSADWRRFVGIEAPPEHTCG